ncbi:MAG: exodeoxyribonuclease V subunit gamma, partial [Luteibacter sp.]
RREDDRYLFLEALLSARDALHIGWVARSARDNSERAPSVLVGQLRDYLDAAWRAPGGEPLLARLSVEHPLQPFSRAYFRDGDPRLFTYASEWRQAHDPASHSDTSTLPALVVERPIGLPVLRRFLRHPVREFFQARLGVRFEVADIAGDDLEPFAVDALGRFAMTDTLLRAAIHDGRDAAGAIEAAAARLQRSGLLPMGGFAAPVRRDISATAAAVFGRFVTERRAWPHDAGKREIRVEAAGVVIEDWLADLRANEAGDLASFLFSPSNVLDADGGPRAHRLVMPWIDHLVAQAAHLAVETRYVGPDATIVLAPIPFDIATAMLTTLLRAWREGMRTPLPVAVRTALAALAAPEEGMLSAARLAYEGQHDRTRGEVDGDPYLTRAWPDFESIERAGLVDWLQPYRDFIGALRVERA